LIPLFPLNIVLFPEGPLPLRIFEPRYVDMVKRCMREASGFGVVLIRSGGEVGPVDMFDVGTLASIEDFDQLADGFLGLSCRGSRRFRILSRSVQGDGLNVGEVEWLTPEPAVDVPERHARFSLLLQDVLPQLGEVYTDMPLKLDDAAWVGHRLAEILPIPPSNKQLCLEMDDPLQRLDLLSQFIQKPS
jgi:Lon protease-like protein